MDKEVLCQDLTNNCKKRVKPTTNNCCFLNQDLLPQKPQNWKMDSVSDEFRTLAQNTIFY
jgi:hypothetical protein